MKITDEQLEEVILKYSSTVRAISRRYYLVGGEEEDLFQEGLIGLFQACKSYHGSGDINSEEFKNFACLCIKRQIYDAIKKANKKHNEPLNTYVPIIKTNTDDQEYERTDILDIAEEYNQEDLFIIKEDIQEKLNQIQSKLSEFEKQVLNLYLSGEKQSEIAKQLKKDVKSIDNTIQRIKNKSK